MSQLKLLKTTPTASSIKNQKRLNSVNGHAANFHAKPIYLNQKLIYVDFAPAKDVDRGNTLEHTHHMTGYKVLVLLVCVLFFAHIQYSYTGTNDSEINTCIMSSLIQFDNEPALSTNIIKILDYSLL
jgi:hypothetical protein